MTQGPDDVYHERRQVDGDLHAVRNWQSVRTVLEGLILVGIVWLASTTQDQARASIKLQTQMTQVSADILALRTQLGNLDSVARETERNSVRLDEHERRITTLESLRTQNQKYQ